jgi:hypothetical protein
MPDDLVALASQADMFNHWKHEAPVEAAGNGGGISYAKQAPVEDEAQAARGPRRKRAKITEVIIIDDE